MLREFNQRSMLKLLSKLLVLVVLLFGNALPLMAQGTTTLSKDDYKVATVKEVISSKQQEVAGFQEFAQELKVDLWGDKSDEQITAKYSELDNSSSRQEFKVGDWVVVLDAPVVTDGSDLAEKSYVVADFYRLPWLIMIGLGFLGFVGLLGGLKGLRSIFGLIVSVLILALYIVPQLALGANPLLSALVGVVAIAVLTFYLSHGFNRRVTIALISTLITLGITVLVSVLFVKITNLLGIGSENATLLQLGQFGELNFQGLLLAGIVIGVLGVLDDVTTSQAATVAELKLANPNLTARELYVRGTRVGKEHIAALVNTLVLAYAGAFLPLFLVFMMSDLTPSWFIVNSQEIAEEIVRTLVGSTALLFAVPITTFLAAKYVKAEEGVHCCKH